MQTLPENSVILNVCLIPEADAGAACVGLSQSLKSDDTLFVLDGESKFAHMTVYMARFDEGEISNVLQAVEALVQNVQSFSCTHSGYLMTEGRYLEVSYRKTKEFMELHESVLETLKAFRINPGSPHEESYFAPYTAAQQRNAEETGYDLAHELYRPHVTLTRYAEGKVPEEFPGFSPATLSFPAHKLCVYKADENGAVYELLKDFSF